MSRPAGAPIAAPCSCPRAPPSYMPRRPARSLVPRERVELPHRRLVVHKIRPATASTNCETPSPWALASATADSAIKFATTPCSVRLAVGDFSTLQIRAARPACAHSSSIGFWRVRVLRRVVKPVILCSTPLRQLAPDIIPSPFCASGEDEAS
jgi:hypothetical protein